MRLFKLCTTSFVLALVGLFFWQNGSIFKTFLPFSFDLHILEPLHWKHHLYTLLLFAGFLGFLAGILTMLKPYRKMRRLLAFERQQRGAVRALAPPPQKKEEAVETA